MIGTTAVLSTDGLIQTKKEVVGILFSCRVFQIGFKSESQRNTLKYIR